MEGGRICRSCKRKEVRAENDIVVCQSCGVVQSYVDDFQSHFGGINGPQGTMIRTGFSVASNAVTGADFSYKENKRYHAQKDIEDITGKLSFSHGKIDEVKRMIEKITEDEYGTGNWFPILIGACSYIVRRKDKVPLPMTKVASIINCDLHELGRMIVRVVEFLDLNLPMFEIAELFEQAIKNHNSSTFAGVSEDKKKKMVKQGTFLIQCLLMWFLSTGRQPTPIVAAVLVFVAELNQVEIKIEDVAQEVHAGVTTTRLRLNELKKTLVKVAQALPWGKNVTVKNIMNNAASVLQYMEMKSRLKLGEKRKFVETDVGFDIDEIVGDCLRKEYNFTSEDDSLYFEVDGRNGEASSSLSDVEKLQISQECLSNIYTKFSIDSALAKSMDERDEEHSRKRMRGLDLLAYKDWWKGNSDLSRKLSLKQVLEKNVGYNGLPPSFVSGILARERRREKINAAKVRIDEIMQPKRIDSTEKKGIVCLKGAKGGEIDWEDCIIELLLLHQVKEEAIEQGHYNTLLDLHVFDSSNSSRGKLPT